MKNVLLISYHFPPSSAVGGIRIVNFAKSLPQFGWNPIVLTLKDKYIEKIDLERLKDIGDIRIAKAGNIFKLSRLYLMIRDKFHSKSWVKVRKHKSGIGSSMNWNSYQSETLHDKLKRYCLAFLSLPDAERNWILPSTIKAIRVIRKNNINCILTSCPPYSIHIVGLLLKILTGVHWIADYRDPWMITGVKSVFQTCKLSLAIEGWIEGKVIHHADTVLVNTKNMRDAYRNRYIFEKDEKFVYLPNMIEPKNYDGFRQLEKYPEFTVSYAGSLYLGRSPEALFAAIQELQDQGDISKGKVRVKLVGNCSSVNGIPIHNLINKYGLDSTVEVSGMVPHSKSLEIIRRSHLGLLLAPDQPLQIPAKLYEYMGLGTKILAIAKGGATSDLLGSVGCGKAFDPTDIEGIKHYLLDSMRQREDNVSEGNRAAIGKFDVSAVVRTLSAELDKLGDRTV